MTLTKIDLGLRFRNRESEFLLNLEKIENSNIISKNRIVKNGFFSDIHMANGHDGLKRIADKKGLKVSDLAPGDFVVFMNRPQTAIKIFTAGNTVAYHKMVNGRINPGVIRLIPKFFNGGMINYDGALSEQLRKQFV